MYEEFKDLTLDQARQYCGGSEQQRVRTVIAQRIGPFRSVIDLCCGPGIDAPRYNTDKYTGIDISPVLIQVAREMNPKHHFLQADATNTGIGGGQVDCVMIKSALEHVPTEAIAVAILREAMRLAKHEVFVAWHTPPRVDLTETKIIQFKDYRPHFGHDIYQNHYRRSVFALFLMDSKVEQIDNFQLWTLKK